MNIKNNVIIEPIRPEDYVFGVNSQILLGDVLTDGNWTPYLPTEEQQSSKNFDTYACVTFSALNSLETQFNYLISSKKLTIEQINFLYHEGYIDSKGKTNFSDRYTSKSSGTIPGKGNSLWSVANSIRHDGLLPEYVYPSVDNVNEYFNEIPQELKDRAKKIYEYFDFNYEWVFSDFEKHLKQAPLQIATAVCSGWSTAQIIQKCDLPVAHATILYNSLPDYWEDFDSYSPFKLKLAKNYNLPWVLKLLIKPKKTMYETIRRQSPDEEVYYIDENNNRIEIVDADTFEAFKGKLWGDWNEIKVVDDETFFSHKKAGAVMKSKST